RDLLRGDRGDERLERVGGKRWPQARQSVYEPCEHGLGRGERGEGIEIELEPEELADDGLGVVVERLDVDVAVGGFDPHLAAADDGVQRAVLPEVGEIRPERAVTLG